MSTHLPDPSERPALRAAGHRGSAIFYLAAAALCYGTIPIFVRYFAAYLDAWTVNGVRYLVGSLIWLPAVLTLRREVPAGKNVWRDALVPTAVNVVGQVGYGLAPYYNPASVIGFVARTSFLFTLLFGFTILPVERLLMRKPLFWLGVAACACGVPVMYWEGFAGAGKTTPTGLAVLLGSAVCWGAYGVSVRRWLSGYPARLSFGVISLYSSAALLVLMFLFGDVGRLASFGVANWAWIVLSGIIGIAMGHVLLFHAIHRLGPVVTEGGIMSTPFITYLGAALVLGERMTAMQWCGGLLLITGGALLVGAKRQLLR